MAVAAAAYPVVAFTVEAATAAGMAAGTAGVVGPLVPVMAAGTAAVVGPLVAVMAAATAAAGTAVVTVGTGTAEPSGVQISLIVFAYIDGTFSGDYRPYVPYPGMNIRNESNPVTIRR